MIRFVLVFTPSVPPLWYGRVTAACTASLSRSRPRVKASRWGRSVARTAAIHSSRRPGLPWRGVQAADLFPGKPASSSAPRPCGPRMACRTRTTRPWSAGYTSQGGECGLPAGPVLEGHPPCHLPDAQRVRPLRIRRRQRRSPCHLVARCPGSVYPDKTGPRAVVKVRAP